MPYEKLSDLPDSVKNNLPQHAQEIYCSAYNNAWQHYKDEEKRRNPNDDHEAIAHKVAWSAVEEKYEKRNGDWLKKNG